ncbi:MAG: heparinase II/III family protein, partial [Pseudomonadota bacterium]
DPWPADNARSRFVETKAITLGDERLSFQRDANELFDLAEPNTKVFDYLHGWRWLRDLTANDCRNADTARALAQNWCQRFNGPGANAWQAKLISERLIATCYHGASLLNAAGEENTQWRTTFFSSVARQMRHLSRVGHKAPDPADRLFASIALITIGLCLPGSDDAYQQGIELLRRESRLQFRSDGGYLSRNTAAQLTIVLQLGSILDAFAKRGMDAPSFLKHFHSRTAEFLALFRLGDGGLAVFQGGLEQSPDLVAKALDGAGEGNTLGFAKYSGFQRMEAAKTVLIADVGAPGVERKDTKRSSNRPFGCGSFNLAAGKHRIVVNCGAGKDLSEQWTDALAQESAFSTFDLEVEGDPANSMRRSQVFHQTPFHRRAENEQGRLIEVERPFLRQIGMSTDYLGVHTRRLFLRCSGSEVIGEDRFSFATASDKISWKVRFHLGPMVRASISRDRKAIILLLQDGQGWRFKSNFKHLDIEKSVYCGGGAPVKSTEQIVLSGVYESDDEEETVVKWGFRRFST